jgi:hypothetical protein
LKFDVNAYGNNVLDTINNHACAPTIYGADSAPIAGNLLARMGSSATWISRL